MISCSDAKLGQGGGLIGWGHVVRYPIQVMADDEHILFSTQNNDFRNTHIPSGATAVTKLQVDSPLAAHVLAFSADSRLALSSAEDKTVRLWEVNGKDPIAIFDRDMIAQAGAFSPNGQRTAACGRQSNVIVLWETATAKLLRKSALSKAAAPIQTLCFSPDGGRLLTGHDDGSLRLWDAETLEELYKVQCIPARINRVIFVPDGQSALCAGADGSVGLWALPN